MKNPPAATAAVAAHDPVRAVVPAQATAVVTRWPPGLIPPFSRNARAATRIPFRGWAARPGCAAACPEWGGDLRAAHACYTLAFRSHFAEEAAGVGACPGGGLGDPRRLVRRSRPCDGLAAPGGPPRPRGAGGA